MSRDTIRERLIALALEWQGHYGVAPPITSTLSEYDAAKLVGMSDNEYSLFMKDMTAVSRGSDFVYEGIRYQVKANRPSGKRGSRITMVPRATNYDWDTLIWVLYDKDYVIQEAWAWGVSEYRQSFEGQKRLSPADYRRGRRLA